MDWYFTYNNLTIVKSFSNIKINKHIKIQSQKLTLLCKHILNYYTWYKMLNTYYSLLDYQILTLWNCFTERNKIWEKKNFPSFLILFSNILFIWKLLKVIQNYQLSNTLLIWELFQIPCKNKGLADKSAPDEEVDISPIDIDFIRKITLNDAYSYLIYLKNVRKTTSQHVQGV